MQNKYELQGTTDTITNSCLDDVEHFNVLETTQMNWADWGLGYWNWFQYLPWWSKTIAFFFRHLLTIMCLWMEEQLPADWEEGNRQAIPLFLAASNNCTPRQKSANSCVWLIKGKPTLAEQKHHLIQNKREPSIFISSSHRRVLILLLLSKTVLHTPR